MSMPATAAAASVASASVDHPLTYGAQVTIRSNSPVDDGFRISARFVDISGDFSTPLQSPQRYAVFDKLPSRERTWRILCADGMASKLNEPVKFGDVVYLSVLASTSQGLYSIFLSFQDTPQNVSLVFDEGGWEKWTIVDPTTPGSTGTIPIGGVFALKSAWGGYLSQPTDPDNPTLQTAASLGDQQSWQIATDPRQSDDARDGYMSYGDEFAIAASTDLCDRRRVAATEAAIGEQPPLPRYAVFDARANESNWRILDPQGRDSEGGPVSPIRFGDTVTLGMVAWLGDHAQTIYLSCRNINNSPPRNVGLNDSPGNSEQWTIIDPSYPDSKNIVTRGSAFALVSAFNDYLSQTTFGDTHVLQTAHGPGGRPSNTETWIIASPVICDPKPVRHQSWISVVREALGEDQPNLVLAAAPGAPDVDAVADSAPIGFKTDALSDLSRWVVERTDGNAVSINFGDTIYLGIKTYKDPTQPKALYLQYICDKPAGEGFQVGVAPPSGGRDWEKWKIVNPDLPMSVAPVRYGDKFALQGLSGSGQYLSSVGGDVMSATPHQSVVGKIGDALTAMGGQMPDMSALPSDTDNSAILLNLGGDLAKTITVGAIGQIPEVGEALSFLVGTFWPSGPTNIWDMIEARVNALIAEKLREQALSAFHDAYVGMQASWQTYVQEKSWTSLQAMLPTLNTLSAQAMNFDHPQETLPQFVGFASLHLKALSETFTHTLDYPEPGEEAAKTVQVRRQTLKKAIADYSNKAREMRDGALQWRKGLITYSTEVDDYELIPKDNSRDEGSVPLGNPYMQDSFLQSNGIMRLSVVNTEGSFDVGQADIDRVGRYQERMAEAFASQLDALTLPALLWRYLDPDCDDVPVRKNATLITGPFGKLGAAEDSRYFKGGRSWNEPSVKDNTGSQNAELGFPVADQTDQPVPITGIAAVGTNCITSIQISPYNPISPNESGSGFAEIILTEGEHIVTANGCEGSQCQAVRFTTNKRNAMAAGNFSGTTWSTTLPPDTHPFLTGISIAVSDDGIDQMYLHWQYERWE
jgi:hypothetical protein